MKQSSYFFDGKLEPPQLTQEVVDRSRLFARTNHVPGPRLTVVEAPAGYGKTTLLTQWYLALCAGGIRAGWLSVDSNDNDPCELVRYLLLAVAKGGIPFGELTPAMHGGFDNIRPRAGAATLLSRVKAFERPFVLFIDDLHKVEAPPCHDFLDTLVSNSPSNLFTVISTRHRPKMNLAHLATQNQLLVIDSDDLRFSLLEGRQFLRGEFTEEDVRVLIARTEGWPVALRLLRTSKNLVTASLIELPSDHKIDLGTYLAEQVFVKLPTEQQDFLMLTSLPSQINGELANLLTQRADSWEMLERIERNNLLLLPVDGQRTWYRYHDLFRDFLRERLKRKPGVLIKQLHESIAEWLADKKLFSAALTHSMEASDYELTARLLERAGGWRVGLRGGMSFLRRVSAIPNDIIEQYPLARLALVYHLMQTSEIRRAREVFEEFRRDSADFTRWLGDELDPVVRLESHIIELGILLYEDMPIKSEFLHAIRTEIAAHRDIDPLLQTLVEKNFYIFAFYDDGQYQRCVELGEIAIAEFEQQRALYALNYVNFYVGLAYFHLGRLQKALEYFHRATDFASRYFPDDYHVLIAKILVGQVRYQMNQTDEARREVMGAMAQLPRNMDGWIPCFETAYTIATRLKVIDGDSAGAFATLNEGQTFASSLGLRRLWTRLEIQRIAELVRRGELETAEQLLHQGELRDLCGEGKDSVYFSCRNYQELCLAKARLLIRQDKCEEALVRLQQVQTFAGAREHVSAWVLEATAYLTNGNDESALDAIQRAITQAEENYCIRAILDEIDYLLPLLQYADVERADIKTEIQRGLAAFRVKWAERSRDDDMGRSLAIEAGDDINAGARLTPRERDVLDLLADGMSSKEIANDLGIAESTVRSYRKTLYQKLNAGKRSQAIENARKLALLQ